MANKTFQIKLTPKYQRQSDYLVLTHRIFNESIVFVMRKIKDMANNPKNDSLRIIYDDMMKISLKDEIDRLQKELNTEKDEIKQQELEKQIRQAQNRRNQGAQDAGRWLDKITNPNAKGVKKDKRVSDSAKDAINSLKSNLVFNRLNVFPYQGADYNFRSMLNPRAARRILNNEVNEVNHKKLLKQAQEDFKEWQNKLKEQNKWDDFDKARQTFENEWQKCTRLSGHDPKKCYCICHKDKIQPCDQYIIDGATIRGWYKHKHKEGIFDLLKSELNYPKLAKEKVIKIIDKYQTEDKKGIGDINFFKDFLADKPDLWDWVGTMREWNSRKFSINKLSRKIAFTYPRWNQRSEWLEYSISSPMPKSFELDLPKKEITLLVFVPNEDIPVLRQNGLLIEDRATKKVLLNSAINLADSIDFSKYQRPQDQGWFKQQPRLDLSKFILCKVKYNFSPDKRLESRIKPDSFKYDSETKTLKDGKIRTSKTKYPTCRYEYSPHSQKELARIPEEKRQYAIMQFSNAKLVFKDVKSPSQVRAYLYLTADIQMPKRELVYLIRQKKAQGGTKIPTDKDLITLAIDLGQRHTAACTVVKFKNGKLPDPLKPKAVQFIRLPGMELPSIQAHDEQKRKLQQVTTAFLKGRYGIKKTRLPLGMKFARELTEHIDHLKEDRVKKAGNQILKLALKHNVGEVLFENLTGFNPTQDYEHSVNRRLRNWNRREIVEWVKTLVKPYGIKVYDFVSASYTSQICYRCGKVGARFAHITKSFAEMDARRKKPAGAIAGMRQVYRGGPLFACPHCKQIINADINASMNLQRVLFLKYEQFIKQSGLPAYKNNQSRQRTERKEIFRETEMDARRFLNEHFKQGDDTPMLFAKKTAGKKDAEHKRARLDKELSTKFIKPHSAQETAPEQPV